MAEAQVVARIEAMSVTLRSLVDGGLRMAQEQHHAGLRSTIEAVTFDKSKVAYVISAIVNCGLAQPQEQYLIELVLSKRSRAKLQDYG